MRAAYEQVFYSSKATHHLGHISDLDIMRTALDHNDRMDITGLLLRDRENFYQFLEGPSRSISTLISKIERDARHHSFQIHFTRSTSERYFAQWAMGYAEVPHDIGQSIVRAAQKGEKALSDLRAQLLHAAQNHTTKCDAADI